MSIGREGPLIEFGGAFGAAIARRFSSSLPQTRVLVAAGTAAGFAAAYNTPFAAVLFVLETIVGIVALDALLPTMVAAVVATELSRAIVGGGPIYGEHRFAAGSPFELLSHGALGVLAVGAAFAFTHNGGNLGQTGAVSSGFEHVGENLVHGARMRRMVGISGR